MTSVCNRTSKGVLRGNGIAISASGQPLGGIAQSVKVEFKRNIAKVYDLSSDDVFYIEAPPEGSLSVSNIVGPEGMPYIECGCCSTADIRLDAGPDVGQVQCSTPTVTSTASLCVGYATALVCKNAIPVGISFEQSTENFVIGGGTAFQFSELVRG